VRFPFRPLWLAIALPLSCAPAADPGPTWRRDVGPLVQSRCGSCHREGGIAPMALTNRDALIEYRASIALALADGRMPPWPAADGCSDYAPTGGISSDEKAQLQAWFDAGAPMGTPGSEPAQLPHQPIGLSRVDLTVTMPEPFTPTKSPDEYRCFVLDWPVSAPTYITGFDLKPGAPQLVHHANLFFIKPGSVADYQAKDAAQAGPGYPCYSFPNPLGGEGGWIGTFVPGSLGADFPEDSGLLIEPGSKLFLQVHYNASKGSLPDASSILLRLADRVKKPGSVQAWADPDWPVNHEMAIPAFQRDVMHSFAEDPTLFLSVMNRSFVDFQPVKLSMAMLHMHALGSKGSIYIQRKDGARECVLDIPRWQFDWQLPYALAAPKTINPGDQLVVECHWDNSAEHQPFVNGVRQTSKDRNWGPNTSDEMCVGGVYFSQ
jgi:hypothetical protein